MSFTTYATAVAGSVLTAAFWNQQVRDNGLIVKTSLDDNGHLVWTLPGLKTTTYSIAATDDVIICSGTFTATLPTAVGRSGKPYTIKNISTGTVTIATTSSQTIDGATTYALTVQYFAVTVVSDGANWHVI